MAAFTELNWQSIDVSAIVQGCGIATIEDGRRDACRNWLLRRGYEIVTCDCRSGIGDLVPKLGELFAWERQFGYTLKSDSRNLNALRDGFQFEIAPSGGLVFELIHPEVIWQEDPEWLQGLLSIISEHSIRHLALGARFFALLVSSGSSPLIGEVFEEKSVPGPFWSPCNSVHQFIDAQS